MKRVVMCALGAAALVVAVVGMIVTSQQFAELDEIEKNSSAWCERLTQEGTNIRILGSRQQTWGVDQVLCEDVTDGHLSWVDTKFFLVEPQAGKLVRMVHRDGDYRLEEVPAHP